LTPDQVKEKINGKSLIDAAVCQDAIEIVKLLLYSAGARPDDKVLHYTTYFDAIMCFQFFMTTRVNVDTCTQIGTTPLHFALRNNSKRMVTYLIHQAKASLKTTSKKNENCTHYAALGGNVEVLKYIQSNYSHLLDVPERFGYTPVFYGVIADQAEVIEFFYQTKVDFNKLAGEASIPDEAALGHIDVLKQLDRLGLQPYKSESTFESAARLGYFDCLEFLLENA